MFLLLLLSLMSFSFAYEDPTEGKPFGPWLYEDQVKPMLREGGEGQHLLLLAGAAGGSFLAKPYDRRVRNNRNEHRNLLMGKQESHVISDFANGWVQIGVSLFALGLDTPEGVRISRTILFTAISVGMLKSVVHRQRPDNSDLASWPSGHSSSMFALAGALAGSYGVAAAVPAYSAAGLVALARMRENKHWLSDVVAGAFIGTYWARVSYSTEDVDALSVTPMPVDDGMMIVLRKSF